MQSKYLLSLALVACEAAADSTNYAGAGPAISSNGATLSNTWLNYSFSSSDNQVNIMNKTEQTLTGEHQVGTIAIARSCVEAYASDDASAQNYICFNYELYVSTFYLRVQKETAGRVPENDT